MVSAARDRIRGQGWSELECSLLSPTPESWAPQGLVTPITLLLWGLQSGLSSEPLALDLGLGGSRSSSCISCLLPPKLWGGPEAGPEVIVTMENVVWSHDGVSQPYLSTASALCTAASPLLPGGGGEKAEFAECGGGAKKSFPYLKPQAGGEERGR